MHPSAILLLLFVAIGYVNGVAGIAAADAKCLPHERAALLDFKRGIISDPTGLLSSWQEGDDQDCCQWRGVRCSNRTGHVLMLQLHNIDGEDYSRSSSEEDTALVGKISPSLLHLEHLEHLDLSMNRLEGPTGRIPEFLGSLKELKYLDLSGNKFVGMVPPQLGNLSRLQYLDLSGTANTNSTDLSWLTRLHFLEHLNLSSVDLSTADDWPHMLNMIPSLRVLDLSYCSLRSSNQSLPHMNFTNLGWLDLSNNYFGQPVASCWFWNVTHLKHIKVRAAYLYGQFPTALEEMTSLRVLDFSDNGWNLLVMTVSLKKLCNLEVLNIESSLWYGDLLENLPYCASNKLRELHLSGGNASGVLPNSIGKLTSLTILDLSFNRITGVLPQIVGHFTSLRILDLSHNHFTGCLPYEIGLLTNLRYLDLNNNDLNGVITEEHFSGLKNLQFIDMSYNSLKIKIASEWKPPFRRLKFTNFAACQMGPMFPSWLRWLVEVNQMDISSAGINDSFPDWFSSAFSNVVVMNMSNNKLHGVLPTNMELMSLEQLYLSSNQISGQIPAVPPNLISLDISMNSLSGHLPPNFVLPKLEALSLFSNHISGHIPKSLCECKQLILIDLANNLFEGQLPTCLGNMEITTLELSNNSLSGQFPPFVQSCTGLKFLDLARNNFSGKLPIWIGKLEALQILRLSHNRFSGPIPIGLTGLECLQYLDISNNGMSGSIPRTISNFKTMKRKFWEGGYPAVPFCDFTIPMQEAYHGVSLSAVMKGQLLNYGTSYSLMNGVMTGIDLSLNNLSGEIPEDIATLDALVNLNLSRNHLCGNIPNNIGDMHSLESLDLSRNKISGQIPESLSKLTFLGYMDLSYNNLTGKIPSGTQLDTLYAYDPTMYAGNVGLCGAPLKNRCLINEASGHGQLNTTEAGYGLDFFYLGLGCGFIVGAWVVVCLLLFSKTWRISYFRLYDMMYDRVYVFVVITWARFARKTTAN